jgi:hypothetical protein
MKRRALKWKEIKGPFVWAFWEFLNSVSKAEKVSGKLTMGGFTSHANPKYFLFHSSHRIFKRMYGALNVSKNITNCIICL